VDERGFCTKTGRCLIEVDPDYFRPTEVDLLIGDASKALSKLGWRHETTARELAREMVASDMLVMRNAVLARGN
jgi:GDPmannose 4,6-dehydratase